MMNGDLIHVFARLTQEPLMAEPRAVAMVLGVLADRLRIDAIELDGEMVPPPALAVEAQEFARDARQYGVRDGIAVVPIIGSLVQRGRALRPISGMTSYQAIQEQVSAAARDPEVSAVLLEVDSPGGVSSGAFAAAEAIRSASRIKPVWAVANEAAFSGGFLMAAGANRIIAPPSAMVGSIGAVSVFVEQGERFAKQGLKVHVIRSGSRKALPNPIEGLDDEAAASIQARLDYIRNAFAAFVADGRPRVGLQEVMDTEARIYGADDALQLGLIDAISPFDEVFGDLLEVANPRPQVGRTRGTMMMTTKTGAVGSVSTDETTIDVTPTGISEQQLEAAVAAARAEAIAGERQRIAAILESDEAEGREGLAMKLAMSTDMAPAAAVEILASAARQRSTGVTSFDDHMAALGNPKVVNAPGDSAEEEGEKLIQLAVGNRRS
jgi:capsid assembly protease